MNSTTLAGLTVLSFESRLADATAQLVSKYGGRPMMAPSMEEIPLQEHSAVFAFADDLFRGRIDVLLCLTGVGTRMMIETMKTRFSVEEIVTSLSNLVTVTRGPKPVKALREFGITPSMKVPEPNTWEEILETFDEADLLQPLGGKMIAIQEYGRPNYELMEGLQRRGARIQRVPIYRWALPEDLTPLEAGIEALIDGRVDVAVFTSRTQIDHVLQLAERTGRSEALKDAFSNVFVSSIGPVCTEGLREHGIEPDFEPSRPKLGVLMKELAAAHSDYLDR